MSSHNNQCFHYASLICQAVGIKIRNAAIRMTLFMSFAHITKTELKKEEKENQSKQCYPAVVYESTFSY